MSVTREERAIIENINKRLDKLEERVFDLEANVDILIEQILVLQNKDLLIYTSVELIKPPFLF